MNWHRIRAARLAGPAVATLFGLAVLLGLGTWQLHRKSWKEQLIARLHERMTAAPVPVAQLLRRPGVPDDIGYYRVSARGVFEHGKEQLLWTGDPQRGPGYHVYTPLKLADGHVLMVNRGYVPEALKAPSARAAGEIAGPVEVVGLLRLPEHKSWFSPERDARTGVWYWRDIDGMRKAALGSDAGQAYPFSIDAEAKPENPGGWPSGGTTIVDLPNRHLEYVLTWYGLALTLVGVFIAFARSRLLATSPPGERPALRAPPT